MGNPVGRVMSVLSFEDGAAFSHAPAGPPNTLVPYHL